MIVKSNRQYWSKEADQALLNLVKVYGDRNWAWIASKLNEIYGYEFNRGPRTCVGRWRILNPQYMKGKVSKSTKTEIFQLTQNQQIMQYDKWCEISKMLTTSKIQNHRVQTVFRGICSNAIRVINKIMCKNFYDRNKEKLSQLKPGVFNKLLELSYEELPDVYDANEEYYQVIKSAKLFFEIVNKMHDQNVKRKQDQFRFMLTLTKMINQDDAQRILEHVFLCNTLHLISMQRVRSQEGQIVKLQVVEKHVGTMMFKGIKKVKSKSWAEAVSREKEIVEKKEEDVGDEEKKIGMKEEESIKREIENELIFTKQEIDIIKETKLYKKIAKWDKHNENNKEMYESYGNALEPYFDDLKMYLFDVDQYVADEANKQKVGDGEPTEKQGSDYESGNQNENQNQGKKKKKAVKRVGKALKKQMSKFEDPQFTLRTRPQNTSKPYKPHHHSYEDIPYKFKSHTWRDMVYKDDDQNSVQSDPFDDQNAIHKFMSNKNEHHSKLPSLYKQYEDDLDE